MTPYQTDLLLDVARTLVAFGLVFVLVPRWTFLRTPGRLKAQGWAEAYRWSGMILMSGACIALVHLLVALGLYDSVALIGSALVLAAAGVIFLRRGRMRRSVAQLYASVLRLLDGKQATSGSGTARLAPRPAVSRCRPLHAWGVALLVLVVMSGVLRLLPIFQHPAPFALQYYADLEAVKYMQLGDLYPGTGLLPRGLHSLVLALHTFSRADPAVLVRVLGVLSGLLLLYGIYRAVAGATENPAAGLAGAALLGLAGSWLPLGLERQIEADRFVLAAAFIVPALYFSGSYILNGGRRKLLTATLGLFAATLTSFVVGGAASGGLLLLALLAALVAGKKGSWRRAGSVVGVALVVGAGLWAGAAYTAHVGASIDPYAVPHFSVAGSAAQEPEPAPLSPFLRYAAFGLSALLVATGLFARHPMRRLAGLYVGISTGALLLWETLGAGPLPAPHAAVPAVLLTATLAVAAGLAVDAIGTLGRSVLGRERAPATSHLPKLQKKPQAPRRVAALLPTLGVLIAGAWAWPHVPAPEVGHPVEPAGFVQALHAVQRVNGPYQWTVVSHYGTGVRAMNQGRFMDYNYFLSTYDPLRYEHGGLESIGTQDVFVFVERHAATSGVREELMPAGRDVVARVQRWCETYAEAHGSLSIFYEDEAVRVYRMSRSPATLTAR